MIQMAGIQDAIEHIPVELQALLDDDLWRLTNAFYGAISWPVEGACNPLIVFLGGRTGLEALVAHRRNPQSEIIIVERAAERRESLKRAFGQPSDKIRIIAPDAFEETVARRTASFLRVDGMQFSVPKALLGVKAKHLCGTFRVSDIDPLALYRLSRDHLADSFFWRENSTADCFGGYGVTPAREVSVVVPAFKVPKEITRCLESLAQQSIASLEVLVVNDGSPDNTGDIAREWEERFPDRIRVIDKKNGGCASARMTGLREAVGDFVGFVDSDDWVDPVMYEDLYRAAVLSGSEISQCGYKEVFEDGSENLYHDPAGCRGPFGIPGLVWNPISLATLRPTIWRRIYRRNFLLDKDIIFPPLPRFDDSPFQFQMFAHAARVAVIHGAYYSYRQDRPEQDIAVRDSRLFVHFEMFDFLERKIMSFGNFETEEQLLRVELNAHVWALGRIEEEYIAEYRQKALTQLARPRTHLSSRDMMRVAASITPKAKELMSAALQMRRSAPRSPRLTATVTGKSAFDEKPRSESGLWQDV